MQKLSGIYGCGRCPSDELMQDALIALWAAEYDPSRGAESTFVFGVVKHAMLKHREECLGGNVVTLSRLGVDDGGE